MSKHVRVDFIKGVDTVYIDEFTTEGDKVNCRIYDGGRAYVKFDNTSVLYAHAQRIEITEVP